jgi:hypothetical protein
VSDGCPVGARTFRDPRGPTGTAKYVVPFDLPVSGLPKTDKERKGAQKRTTDQKVRGSNPFGCAKRFRSSQMVSVSTSDLFVQGHPYKFPCSGRDALVALKRCRRARLGCGVTQSASDAAVRVLVARIGVPGPDAYHDQVVLASGLALPASGRER